MLSWLMEGVDIIYKSKHLNVPVLPIPDVFYADDTILLSTNPVDLQTRFSILEDLAAQVGLHMNRDKTVLILAKVKSKQTLGKAKSGYNRIVKPFKIQLLDCNIIGKRPNNIFSSVTFFCITLNLSIPFNPSSLSISMRNSTSTS